MTSQSDGKYRLIVELGRGGMGTVYLAVATGPAGFNKLQVIKRLRPDLAEEPGAVTMFLDEARVAARLNHQNVVQTNKVGFDGQFYFIAMEYLEGQTLELIQRRSAALDGRMPVGVHLRILCDALAGLHYAHELVDFDGKPLNVVHRDVSPQNIFVTYDGQTKLLDFGIAKAATSIHLTESGVFRGKTVYAAPEQALVEDGVDRRADLFSVGAILWQVATGERLWKGESEARILNRLAAGQIPAPRSKNPDIPERLNAICMRALAARREDRYSTAAELLADLEGFMEEHGETATSRDVGRLVSTLFAEDRERVRLVIESQLKEATVALETDLLPSLSAFPLNPSPISRQRPAVLPPQRPGTPALAEESGQSMTGTRATTFRRVRAIGGAAATVAIAALLLLWKSTPRVAPPLSTRAAAAPASSRSVAPTSTRGELALSDVHLGTSPRLGEALPRQPRAAAESLPRQARARRRLSPPPGQGARLHHQDEDRRLRPGEGGRDDHAGSRAPSSRGERHAAIRDDGEVARDGLAAEPRSEGPSDRHERSMEAVSMPKRLARVALVTTLLSLSAPSVAQTADALPAPASEAAVADARAHYQRGIELTNEGAFEAALVEFDRAYSIAANYRILYNVALLRRRLNDFAGACDAFERYLAGGGDEVPPARRTEVLEALRGLATYVGALDVQTNVDGATVLIDDVDVGKLPLAKPLRVSLGLRRIAVAKPGYFPAARAVAVAGGDRLTVTIELTPVPTVSPQPAPALAPPPAAAPPPPPDRATGQSRNRRPLWIGWVATGALAASATASGVVALASASLWQANARAPRRHAPSSTRITRERRAGPRVGSARGRGPRRGRRHPVRDAAWARA